MKKTLLLLAGFLLLGGLLVRLFYPQQNQAAEKILSRDGIITQIKQINRLESTAFYIDTIIRTEKKGDWRKLWQDAQSGLFIVRGKVLAGLNLDKLTQENINIVDGKAIISLPPVEILSADLENIEIYDLQTGTFNLLPAEKTLFQQVQTEAKRQILASACKADILQHATRQAAVQLENLFTLTQTQVSVYPAAAPPCKVSIYSRIK
ncbi:DUF4230 domain-containing protein [Neisseria animalis]|uniref:DUF4230 domain-containing protein n=1 Tax=Neisseria animalis TaxID=492 RepID=A0A5P3MQD1_NEIAN|nr:DUF4230 domain-containing protein [Neisseria animalis]QEY23275.1 DUF4230 domain-containing protein [Neisseria animalis]ROW31971.1 DUF4230 domain-containing protein [Neisseria animalis]VEE08563.1 Uncharacterised protein [Neisseria animalis]